MRFFSYISTFFRCSLKKNCFCIFREEKNSVYVQFVFFGEKSEKDMVPKQIKSLHLDICGLTNDANYLVNNTQPGVLCFQIYIFPCM